MNAKKILVRIITSLIALSLSACGETATPAPPIIYVSTPEVEIIGAYMLTDLGQLDSPETITNRFPSGITKLNFAIKLGSLPSELSIEVYANDTLSDISSTFWMTTTSASGESTEATVSTSLKSPTGVFVDGAYQTKIYLDSELVLILNWFVGE